MQSIEQIFGKVIRQLRENSGISQEDFAELVGIHRTYVSSIELGKVRTSIAIAQKLATALKVPLSKIWKQVEAELDQS